MAAIESDEQMAHRLAREDDLELRAAQEEADSLLAHSLEFGAPSPRTASPLASAPGPGTLPYAPYVPSRRRAPQPAMTAEQDGDRPRDELDELGERFAKLAEQGGRLALQGKKTLGSFFEKIKAKVDELDGQSVAASGSSSRLPPLPPQSQDWTPPSALPRPQSTRQASVPVASKPAAERPLPVVEKALPADAPPSLAAAVTDPVAAATADVAPAPIDVAPKTDFSHIGLLPRQSVSLLDDPAHKDHHDEDSEEDLEYVRSPFDDD